MIKIPTGSASDSRATTEIAKQEYAAKRAENLLKKPDATDKEINKAAGGFEALLLHNMLKEMWATVDTKGDIFGEDSNQSQVYRDMFHQAMADKISEGRGIGVQDFLKRELVKAKSASKKETPSA